MTSASAAAKLALKTTKRPRSRFVTPSATWARSTGGANTSRPAPPSASPRANVPRGSQPIHGWVSRLQPSGATFPERTCPRTSRVAMRQVRKGRMTLVPIVSPAMLCCPQSGVVRERDLRPETAEPEDAFAAWERRGVPQFRHSHAFLARLRVVLLAHLPDVLDRLRAVGVREFGLDEVTPPGVTLAPRADDEDVVLLACRRSTFEWALRASVAGRPGIELREGVVVEGLSGEARDGGRPTVTGVRLADGSTIPAAIVVGATGRRSRAPQRPAAPRPPPPLAG